MLEALFTLSTKVMKYLLFLSNLVFVLTGLSLIVIGAIIKSSTGQYSPVYGNSNFATAPNLLIFLGCFVFFIAFLGCCGTLQESHCMIFTFSVLMVAIFIAEAAVGLTGYALRGKANETLTSGLNFTMHQYVNSTEDKQLWDMMQGELSCCGTFSFEDWKNITNDYPVLPLTCCTSTKGEIGILSCNTTSLTLHHQSCLDALSNLFKDSASTIGLTGLIIAAIQLFSMIFACVLAYSFKRSSYESV